MVHRPLHRLTPISLLSGHQVELWMQRSGGSPTIIVQDKVHVAVLCAISPTIAWQVEDNGPVEILERIAVPSAPVATYAAILSWAGASVTAGRITTVPTLSPTPLFKYYSIARTAAMLGIEPLVTELSTRFDKLANPDCMRSRAQYQIDTKEIIDAYRYSKREYGLQEKLVDCIARAIMYGMVGGYTAKMIGNAERVCDQFSRDLKARKEELAPRYRPEKAYYQGY